MEKIALLYLEDLSTISMTLVSSFKDEKILEIIENEISKENDLPHIKLMVEFVKAKRLLSMS